MAFAWLDYEVPIVCLVFMFASKLRGYLYHRFKGWHHRHAPWPWLCLEQIQTKRLVPWIQDVFVHIGFCRHAPRGCDKLFLHNIYVLIIIIESKMVLDYLHLTYTNSQKTLDSYIHKPFSLFFLNEAANQKFIEIHGFKTSNSISQGLFVIVHFPKSVAILSTFFQSQLPSIFNTGCGVLE